MNEVEKHLCEWLLENGTIIRHGVFDVIPSGEVSEQWTIVVDGESYDITKLDGEWIYFHHNIV